MVPNKSIHKASGTFAITLAATLLVAGASMAQQLSPDMQTAVAAANKEGSLTVVWPGTMLGGAKGVPDIEKGMEKMFGAKIKISHTPTGSLIQQGFQLVNETKANAPASTDIYVAVVNVFGPLEENKVLLPVNWPALLPGRINDSHVELNGAALKISTGSYGVSYNTRLMPNPPKTLEGYLAATMKGKIAVNPQGVGFDYLLANDVYGKEKTFDFLKKFSGQIGGLIFCTEINRVTTGEFAGFMFDCGPNEALRMKENSLPIDQILLRDHLPVTYFYGTIPRTATHPNAAKVLLAYLMTEEGQKLQWDLWRTDLDLLPGSNIGKRIDEAVKDGAKPLRIDAKWYASHPEVDAARNDMIKILREGR